MLLYLLARSFGKKKKERLQRHLRYSHATTKPDNVGLIIRRVPIWAIVDLYTLLKKLAAKLVTLNFWRCIYETWLNIFHFAHQDVCCQRFCACSMFYCAVLYVLSSFAVIFMGRRAHLLYFVCLTDVLWLQLLRGFFLTVSWVGLFCGISWSY